MRFSYLLSVFLPLRKSVQIRIYFWSVFSCIQSEYRKIRTTNNSAFGHFPRSVAPNDRELFLDGIEDWERISNFCMLHVVYEKEHYEYYEQENLYYFVFLRETKKNKLRYNFIFDTALLLSWDNSFSTYAKSEKRTYLTCNTRT